MISFFHICHWMLRFNIVRFRKCQSFSVSAHFSNLSDPRKIYKENSHRSKHLNKYLKKKKQKMLRENTFQNWNFSVQWIRWTFNGIIRILSIFSSQNIQTIFNIYWDMYIITLFAAFLEFLISFECFRFSLEYSFHLQHCKII